MSYFPDGFGSYSTSRCSVWFWNRANDILAIELQSFLVASKIKLNCSGESMMFPKVK